VWCWYAAHEPAGSRGGTNAALVLSRCGVRCCRGTGDSRRRAGSRLDSDTRDIVQNVYIRKVEKKNGELYNVEFATFPNIKDPIKAAVAK
jgi:hypothetical protein